MPENGFQLFCKLSDIFNLLYHEQFIKFIGLERQPCCYSNLEHIFSRDVSLCNGCLFYEVTAACVSFQLFPQLFFSLELIVLSLESEDDSNQFRMMYQETPGETGEI